MKQTRWEPVEPGWIHVEHCELNKPRDAIEVRKSAYETIANCGVLLTVSEQWGENEASVYLPDDLRLCRLVEVEADPVPTAEVMATIRDALRFQRYYQRGKHVPNSSGHLIWQKDQELPRRIDSALAWLDTLGGSDK